MQGPPLPATRFLALAAIACIACGCRSGWPLGYTVRGQQAAPLVLEGTHEQMREIVQHHVPIGTPVEEAAEVMQEHGFQCTRQLVHGKPALACVRRIGRDQRMRYEHHVVFWNDGGRVADIEVETLGISTLPPAQSQASPSDPNAEEES